MGRSWCSIVYLSDFSISSSFSFFFMFVSHYSLDLHYWDDHELSWYSCISRIRHPCDHHLEIEKPV